MEMYHAIEMYMMALDNAQKIDDEHPGDFIRLAAEMTKKINPEADVWERLCYKYFIMGFHQGFDIAEAYFKHKKGEDAHDSPGND